MKAGSDRTLRGNRNTHSAFYGCHPRTTIEDVLSSISALLRDFQMTRVVRSRTTPTARIEVVQPGHVEERFFSEARFSTEVFQRNCEIRRALTKGAPHTLLVDIPEEIPVHPPSTNKDHFRNDRELGCITALAIVARSEEMSAVTKFYFRYYPQPFEVAVFADLDSAREWIQSRSKP